MAWWVGRSRYLRKSARSRGALWSSFAKSSVLSRAAMSQTRLHAISVAPWGIRVGNCGAGNREFARITRALADRALQTGTGVGPVAGGPSAPSEALCGGAGAPSANRPCLHHDTPLIEKCRTPVGSNEPDWGRCGRAPLRPHRAPQSRLPTS